MNNKCFKIFSFSPIDYKVVYYKCFIIIYEGVNLYLSSHVFFSSVLSR